MRSQNGLSALVLHSALVLLVHISEESSTEILVSDYEVIYDADGLQIPFKRLFQTDQMSNELECHK